MAVLTTKKRNRLRPQSFAIPSTESYPIPDLAHARNAIQRVVANGSPAEQKMVFNAVKRKFPGLAARSTVIPTKTGPGRRFGEPKGTRHGR